MAGYGEQVADKAIEQTARKIRRIYTQAAKELREKMVSFNERFAQKTETMRNKLESGEITKAAYESWLRGQVFMGRQWAQKADQAVRVMQDANTEAKTMIDNGKLNVFAENYNYTAYEIDKQAGAFLNFNLYDEDAVEKLIREKPKMLPEWKIDEKKDYKWNRQKVENSITQGIIQGEGIDQITDRLVDSLCTQNENRMRTFARTSMTGAQNAGRQASMEDAEDMGIKLKKRWLATLDNRTRDLHQELDGQIVDVDEPFEVDLNGEHYEIRYPGDPNAEPEMVYNCRCTMIEIYEGIDRKSVRRDMDNNEIEDMTYKEWKAMKEGKQPEEEPKTEPETQPEENHVDNIRQMIDDHQGDWSTEELQELGQEVSAEIDDRIAENPPPVDYDKKIEELDSELEQLYSQYEAQHKAYNRSYSSSDREVLNKLATEYNERYEMRKKFMEESSEYYSGILSKTISEIREVGGVTKETRAAFMTAKTGKAADALQTALNHYPSAWLQHSSASTIGLKPKWTTGRACYQPGLGNILVDGKLGTGIHELAHRFERCVPGLRKAEQEFYARRTSGEPLKWLGRGYRPNEMTRKDNFINKYMGKDYGGTAYELASMGFEYAYTQYGKLKQDKDMLDWVLGLLFGL